MRVDLVGDSRVGVPDVPRDIRDVVANRDPERDVRVPKAVLIEATSATLWLGGLDLPPCPRLVSHIS